MIRAIALWLLLALPVVAQDLPPPMHTSVNDFAQVLTNDDTRAIDQALIALHDQTGIEGTVVTMTDRARYGGTDGLEPFATRLFNHWGVGDAQRNDGFMVLLLKDDRETRIELGAGYPRGYGDIAAQIVASDMLPNFRAGDYSAGLRQGTMAVISRIAQKYAAGQPPDLEPAQSPDSQPVALRPERPGPTFQYVVIGAVLAFIAAVGGLLGFGALRKRLDRNRCPQCRSRDLITMEGPVRQDNGDGSWTFAEMSVSRHCPNCGWSEERRIRQPQSITYGANGAVLSTVTHAALNGDLDDRHRNRGHRGERSDRRDRGDRGGGFGGGGSSGGGASGRW